MEYFVNLSFKSFLFQVKKILVNKYIKLFFTVVIIAIIFYYVDFAVFVKSYQTIDIGSIVILVLIILFFWFQSILSFYLLVIPIKRINFIRFSIYHLYSIAVGFFSPAQIGETLIIHFLNENEIPVAHGTSAFLINKLVNIFFICLSCFLILLYMDLLNILFYVAILVLIPILITTMVIFFKDDIKKHLIKRFFNRFYDFFKSFYDFFKIHYNYLILNVLVNIGKILTTGLYSYVLFRAFHVEIDYVLLLSVISLTRILTMIPLTINGIGIQEGSIIKLLELLGYDDYSLIVTIMVFYRLPAIIMTASLLLLNVKINKNN